MRSSLVSTSRGLCASCWAQTRACAPLASAAATRYSTTIPAPQVLPNYPARQQLQQRQQLGSTQQRQLSSQSPPEAVQEAQQQERQDRCQPPNKEWDHTKPLPYYDLFPETLPRGPPPQGPFDIDVRALRREFLRLQAATHPDYFHSASTPTNPSDPSSAPSDSEKALAAKRRRQAEAASSHINAAYKTLSHPLLRAQYILAERYGVDLAGDEAGSHTGGASGPIADPALLVEVLEAREAIDEAESEADLEGPMAENEERIARCVQGLRRAFSDGNVEDAVGEAIRLRYWESIKEGIRGWEKGAGAGLLHH
jgi:molecular chaperone HscB